MTTLEARPIVDRIPVIDADTHVSEPPDLWTSRVSSKWGELVPHVRHDENRGEDRWWINGQWGGAVAGAAMAGWKEPPPSHPPTMDEADPGAWHPVARLQRMDEYGIHAQVIYPNVGGFGSGNFLRLGEPELMYECVRAYNDFLTEWCATDPNRLLPIMAMPFWDVDLCIKEMERCAKAGHRGVLWGSEPEFFGQPHLSDPHWDPVYATAQDLGLTMNYHIGSGDLSVLQNTLPRFNASSMYAKVAVEFFLANGKSIINTIFGGICERYPRLNFVSVESGIGWVPFLVEAMDWQWLNGGCPAAHPEMSLLPSEYFRRQVYACFWFEETSAISAIKTFGADNFLFETDFPHPTSLSPGPASHARNPKQHIEEVLKDLTEDELKKVLHDNAARLYGVS